MSLNSLQLFDLNGDVLLEIFEKMEFEDLLSSGGTNSRFRELIGRYYMINKFRIHEKFIEFRSSNTPSVTNSNNITIRSDSITIYSRTTFTRLLQNFGNLISLIYISHDEINGSIADIGGLVNKYCSESLLELLLYHGDDWNVLWHKSFKKLTKLHLTSVNLDCEVHTRNSSEVFPSLQHLALSYFDEHGSVLKCFDHHFPHLESFGFSSHWILDSANEFVRNFMKLNPGIRKVDIPARLLRIINEKLPNLEETNQYGMEKNDSAVDNLVKFDRLKELEIEGPDYITDQWTSFIARNRELRILKVWVSIHLYKWIRLVGSLPHLDVIMTDWNPRGNVGGEVIDLMSRETNLKRVTFRYGYSREIYTFLRQLVHPKWKFEGNVKDHMPEITFIQSN